MNGPDSHITIDKLKGKEDIDLLFKQGVKINSGLVMFRHLIFEQPKFAIKVGFSAPKKIFPKAVDRNKVKRLLREAFHIANQSFATELQKKGKSLNGIFMYHGTLDVDFRLICTHVNNVVAQLLESVEAS